MASEKTAVGMPEGRLQVRAGEIVRFRVESGNYEHGVLFEKAKSELEARVWEAVKDSEELKTVPDSFTAFDRNNVQTTDPKGPGSMLIEIKINKLNAGAENGILFACNPPSLEALCVPG